MKKRNVIILFFVLLAISGGVLYKYERRTVPPQTLITLPEPQPLPASPNPASDEPPQVIPDTFLLQIPFTAQAPTGNWDELHNEACEEASSIMAAAYFARDTRKVLPATEVEKQLSTLTEWQNKHLGYSLDTTAEETAQMIRAVYNLKTKLVSDFTEADVKNALLEHKVVILPANGRKLGNPNFRQPGPIYHMLVIRGYTKKEFIVNDPGTRRGENYPYTFATLRNAVADWNHTTNTIDDGKAVIIIVSN
jgi:hypothetical protein